MATGGLGEISWNCIISGQTHQHGDNDKSNERKRGLAASSLSLQQLASRAPTICGAVTVAGMTASPARCVQPARWLASPSNHLNPSFRPSALLSSTTPSTSPLTTHAPACAELSPSAAYSKPLFSSSPISLSRVRHPLPHSATTCVTFRRSLPLAS